MKKVLLQDIKILFECEDHQTTQTCDPIDLTMSGTPMCEICNDEMSIASDYAEVDIQEEDSEPYGSKVFRRDDS